MHRYGSRHGRIVKVVYIQKGYGGFPMEAINRKYYLNTTWKPKYSLMGGWEGALLNKTYECVPSETQRLANTGNF
jgi:hypothetical protein